MDQNNSELPLEKIAGVRIPGKPSSELWDIAITNGKIASVSPHDSTANISHPHVLDGCNRLIAPSLCHAHIHLDKCFLLQDPKYSDLQIQKGDFNEAMEMTNIAKAKFDEHDLLRRGRQLIEESIEHGVTAMRAFVEVDGLVHFKCLDAGLKLQHDYKSKCEIQICAFAQLPLFSGDDGGAQVRDLMAAAAANENVQVLGSTPYVEDDEAKSKENVRWITQLALEHHKHLDLHLDYFLEEDKQPLVWDVLQIVKRLAWPKTSDKQITLGHCTRLTRFRDEEWIRLKQEIGDLPVSFVGLPTSDLFMMRTPDHVRGTLPVIQLINTYGLNAAIAVNNVGNAFTPQGSCDPLRIAELGIGLYQAGTQKEAELLYVSSRNTSCPGSYTHATMQEAVSFRAKAAIGCVSSSLSFEKGQWADFVLFDRMDSGWRCRRGIPEVVYNAPTARQTVFRGLMTAAKE